MDAHENSWFESSLLPEGATQVELTDEEIEKLFDPEVEARFQERCKVLDEAARRSWINSMFHVLSVAACASDAPPIPHAMVV